MYFLYCGRDNSVGIGTRYELVGSGIESRWGRNFPHPPRPALGRTQPPIQWLPDLFPGVKRPEPGFNHPPPSSTEVKERVELYLYSPSGLSYPVLGRTLLIIWQFFNKISWYLHLIYMLSIPWHPESYSNKEYVVRFSYNNHIFWIRVL